MPSVLPMDGGEAPLAGPPADTIFDREAALASADGDLALLREVAEVFLAHREELVGAVADAVARADAGALVAAAHSLKGSVGSLGSRGAYEAAQRLESAGRSRDLLDAAEQLAELRAGVARLSEALAELLVEAAPECKRPERSSPAS